MAGDSEYELFEALLPGRDRSICYIPRKGEPGYISDLLPSALNLYNTEGVAMPMTTRRELMMLQLMNTITDKPQWNIKINDPEIAAKWREEALTSGADITAKMMDWCLDELRYKSSLVPKDCGDNLPPVIVYNGDVVKSDNALSPEFKRELQEAVAKFESAIPDRLKDWHPGSDGKVRDLVHPLLYPLVYGRTRVLERGVTTTLEDCIQHCGKGKVFKDPAQNAVDLAEAEEEYERENAEYNDYEEEMCLPYSTKFQWLPCEVDISGDEPRITSYINNLHPLREKPLYKLIEQIIKASIPLWNLTLAPGSIRASPNLRIHYYGVKHAARGMTDSDLIGPNAARQAEDGDEDDGDSDYEWGPEIRPQPNILFRPPRIYQELSIKEKCAKRGLQVIVKLANIQLTPEKPEYNGGDWHLEGEMNEHIVATSLYYYSNSNITSSTLYFRQSFQARETEWVNSEQWDHEWLWSIFGVSDYCAVQDVGGVDTREGRLLTFPNVLLHRVGAFKLADATKPGHRKIIALFLVDPNMKIISTAHVPCQRQDWWWESVTCADEDQESSTSSSVPTAGAYDIGADIPSTNLLDQLPVELHAPILEDVDFPLSLQDAKALREELMEERKDIEIHFDAKLGAALHISLCEH